MKFTQLIKTNHAKFGGTLTLFHGPHSVECASLWIWINPLLTITLSLTEFFLSWDIKNLSFIRSWNQVLWVLAGSESQPCGFKSQSEVNSFKFVGNCDSKVHLEERIWNEGALMTYPYDYFPGSSPHSLGLKGSFSLFITIVSVNASSGKKSPPCGSL